MRDPIVPQLSAEEFLSWESRQPTRYELHEGFIVAFAGGLAVHDRLSFNLRTIFERVFPSPCRSFGSDLKIKASAQHFFYADAGVVCDDDDDDDVLYVKHPRVVGEVLSPSTRAYDLIEKRATYREIASLEVYVIVHTMLRRVEIDELHAGAWNTRFVEADDVDFLGATFTLDELYARTSVPLGGE